MDGTGLRTARVVGLIASFGLLVTGLGRYWWYRMEPRRNDADGIHFPWAEAFPLLIAGCIVLSLSIIVWTYSSQSSTRERVLWLLVALLLASLSVWGLTYLRANEVIEGVQYGTEGLGGSGVTVAPAIPTGGIP